MDRYHHAASKPVHVLLQSVCLAVELDYSKDGGTRSQHREPHGLSLVACRVSQRGQGSGQVPWQEAGWGRGDGGTRPERTKRSTRLNRQ